MRNWFRVHLGKKASQAQAGLTGGYVGVDYGFAVDLIPRLGTDLETFADWFTPTYLALHPGKTRNNVGVPLGAIWTLCNEVAVGDLIVAPVGDNTVRLATVTGSYFYAPEQPLPHRRPVAWFGPTIATADVSNPLRVAINLPLSVISLAPYTAELDHLAGDDVHPVPTAERAEGLPPEAGGVGEPTVTDDPLSFEFESHLQNFLVHNWPQTPLGAEFDIYEEEGDLVGVRYPTATGPLDILAVSKDRRTLLVVELKRGQPSDAVVGQTLRYMAYVKERVADEQQSVHGAIIALTETPRLKWALKMVPTIRFYRYEVDFRLV